MRKKYNIYANLSLDLKNGPSLPAFAKNPTTVDDDHSIAEVDHPILAIDMETFTLWLTSATQMEGAAAHQEMAVVQQATANTIDQKLSIHYRPSPSITMDPSKAKHITHAWFHCNFHNNSYVVGYLSTIFLYSLFSKLEDKIGCLNKILDDATSRGCTCLLFSDNGRIY